MPATTFPPKSPGRKRDATRSVSDRTSLSVGTSFSSKLGNDTNQVPEFDSAEHAQYQEFKRSRVFVGIEVFMKNVLHVPEGWRKLWGRTIEKIKHDKAFSMAYLNYSYLCNVQGAGEELCEPLMDMTNAILRCSNSSLEDCVEPRTVQRYVGFFPHLYFKLSGSTLVDGSCMPRLKVNGRDPQKDHARPYTPKKATPSGAGRYTHGEATPALEPGWSRKRPANEPSGSSRKTAKTHHKSTPGGASSQVSERESTKRQNETYLRVAQYILRQFEISPPCPHITMGLVDRDRIQFYHANHSVVLVSSGISFSPLDRTGGLDKFIAIIIALGKLSLRDSGIHYEPHESTLLSDKKLPTSGLAPGAMRMLEEGKLEFGGDEKTGAFTLTYEKAISQRPSLVGRSTAVLHAKSSRWEGLDLVVKISWPDSDWVPESAYLTKAVETAESTPADEWALKHLPRVLFTQDIIFDSDSAHSKVASLFDDSEFVNEDYAYGRRALRIIIQERLYSLKSLKGAKEVAQVLLDVGCIHRWLYVRAGILHRDLSLNNIMVRTVERKNEVGDVTKQVYGVLTDFDISSWTEDLKDPTKMSPHKIKGTIPFMAHELLWNRTDTLPMYRHDLEALFYNILVLVTNYEIRPPTDEDRGGLRRRQELTELPYREWFNVASHSTIAFRKRSFISNLQLFDLPPSFEGFREWLQGLHSSFRQGIRDKDTREDIFIIPSSDSLHRRIRKVAAEFDYETLGGSVDYSTLIDPVRKLKGDLEGLIIRYDPSPPIPTEVDSGR